MTTAEIAETAKLSGEAKALLGDGVSPSKYVDILEGKKLFEDGILFLAYGLPVSVGARWAASCCHELMKPEDLEKTKPVLDAAESWIAEPSDPARFLARDAAGKHGAKSPPGLLAMAVFFSGGNIASAGAPDTAPPPHVANKLIAAAIKISVLSDKPDKAKERYAKALELSRATVKKAR